MVGGAIPAGLLGAFVMVFIVSIADQSCNFAECCQLRRPIPGAQSLPGVLAAEPEAHDDAGAEALARAKLVEAANPVHPPQPRVSALTVLVMTVIMACAAGLGALPFFVIQSLSPTLGAIATATACGVMFAASFDLIHEGGFDGC